ncbi:WRKY transcription factor 31 [Spatholobus suberectus]|nr:WRKY transcription factor 31 [Spatholobus suberectus]
MARGGGLSIDSDPIGSFFPHKPVVLNSFPEDKNNKNSSQHKWKLGPNMDATVSRKRSPSSTPNTNTNTTTTITTSTIPFQVNLTSPPPSDDKRPHIDEMDFFPNKTNNDDNNNLASASTSAPPSLDHLHHTHDHSSTPAILELKVNTGLNLLTTNISSDQSMVDDDIEDRRTKSEMVVLQAELERMKVENHRLRNMLDQVNNNYNALQMHLVSLMQEQKGEEEGEEKTTTTSV